MSLSKQTDNRNTIVEETTGVGHRISALEQKVEKIKSFLVKIEKFLDDKDRLEKQNLGGKEKEESSVLDELQQYLRDAKVTKNQKEEIQASRAIASHAGGSPESSDPILEQNHLMTVPEEKNGSLTQSHQWVTQKNDESLTRRFEPLFDGGNAEGWVIRVEQYFERGKVTEQKLFGIVNTEKKDTQEENHSAEMDRNACQVFDEITQEGKKVAKKRKKKRWKASLKVQERLEKQLSSEEKLKTSLSCEEIRNGFYVNRKQGDIKKSIYASQVFDKRSRKKKRETRKRKNKKFTKAKRSKYKRWKGDPLNFELDNTTINLVKSMGRKDLPKYPQREASLGKELIERGGNKRALALSLVDKEIARAALEGKNKSLVWSDCNEERQVWERLDIALICRARMKMSAAGQVGERLPKANISKQLYGSAAMLALLIDRRHQARQGMQAQAGHEEALVKCQVQHENTKLVAKQSLHFNLEDKVKFKGGSIVRSSG
ncbi:unnamed protein product [Microthlaspi erraticum]|uniref:Uncharacterized protein n=1 Tax=Microthlaspi erraticum TaxID=1685480 RepID=A0A6D2I348_9BRAS|nr:unnamed protein product [Microthlaspi erraticum]